MSTQTALKMLFELRAVLDRLQESDMSLHETLAQDIERAVRLADSCIAQLSEDFADGAEAEQDEEEEP